MNLNKNVAVSESGFIFNPTSGDSFSTNQTGVDIIQLLKKNASREDIIKEIGEKYVVDEATIEKDFTDFLLMLNNYQLVLDEQ